MSVTSESTDVIKIFEYLLAVKNLNEKPVLNVNQYEKVWWQHELPNTSGCFLFGSGELEEAWLEVHKQNIVPAPAPPKLIGEWVENWDNPDKAPQKKLHVSKGTNSETEEEEFEAFADEETRETAFDEWMENEWNPWAVDMAPKYEIQKVYDRLFALYQQLQRMGDDMEIAWGHGLLNWEVSGAKIQRHMLVTKLEMQFDAKRGLFALIPTSRGTELETDMLPTTDIPNMDRMMEMEKQVGEVELEPWNDASLEAFFNEIVHTINSRGTYSNVKEKPEGATRTPVITYSPAIFLRKSGGRLWQNELSNVVEKIKNGYPVPGPIKQLTTSREEQSQTQDLDTALQTEWQGVGEQLLFPLPTNNEQQLIARKLSNHDGVLVQGPPGTGKSHTIANLISHLLAHGKRILVTSEKEQALQVLRDKIPEEIRALCVSVLGGDSRSVKEIEDSVKFIAENLDSQQPETLKKNIQGLETELDQTKRNIAEINTEINQAAETENKPITIDEDTYTPLEASKWLNENSTHSWLPDRLRTNQSFPLNEEETNEFFKLLGIIKTEDRKSLAKNPLSSSDIVPPEKFEKAASKVKSIEQELQPYENALTNWEIGDLSYSFHVEEKLKLTKKSMEQLASIQGETWRSLLLKEMLENTDRKEKWSFFYENMSDELQQIEALRSELIAEKIEIPEDVNLTVLKEDLDVIRQRLDDNKSIGWMYKNITGRKYSYLFDTCKINGVEIRHQTDAEKIIKYADRNILIQKLVLKWNRAMYDYAGPTIEEEQKRLTPTVRNFLDQILEILNWEEHVIRELEHVTQEISIPEKAQWDSVEWFQVLTNGLTAIGYKRQLQQENKLFEKTMDTLKEVNENAGSVEIVHVLMRACKEKDVIAWKDSWNELKRLEALNESFIRYRTLRKKLENITPLWLEQLEDKGGKGYPLYPPEDLPKAWKWKQLATWIEELNQKKSMEELEEELQLEIKNESKLIKQLVSASTWKSQIERTTKEQKRSLFAWLKAIQRVGKGTGKYANVYRKEASKEMTTARGAIPVWIMPIKSVIENLDLTDDPFDVVIVDESSQSNLFSLSALLRAKKAVIVGDDNQISPESVGTDISEIHDLIERHLTNIPNKLQFEMKTSLYDTASRVFDSKIVLREHFRSVPEIIQFSNDLMYGGMIDPLRLPLGKDVLDPPVKAIRVKDGYRKEDTRKAINEPEAEAIVHEITRLCTDPQYADKTFGVISLQGHHQAQIIENMLREAIGEEEMINRKIICGDAYSFQGDERDVIFMSLVAAPNMRIGSMTRRADYQRFNVAASRARDQMLLFHSTELNDLNPECARYKLLQYCKEPYRMQQEIDEVKDEFDSQFEEDVFRMIKARGYRVVPQVQVGTLGKKIDLVVEGMRSRLAVECDGDRWHGLERWEEDIERQRVLERVGWTFWRVRGSQFYLDRGKAMEPLWKKLDEMGIYPIG